MKPFVKVCESKVLRPYGLTVSEDGNLINWCGRNYVPQNNKEGQA